MIIRINSTNVRYSESGEVASVQVHFSGHDDQRSINVSGYIPLTAEEYNGNESINALTGVVKQKIVEKLAE